MKDVGYLEVLLFGLDTWKSLASLQIVASVCTVAQEMGANLLLVTLKHADNESSLKSLKILMRLRLTKVAKRSIWKRAVEQEDQRMKDAEVVEQPQSVQTQDALMTSSSLSSPSSRASSSSSSSSQADDGVPIATSVTASTDRDSASKGKRVRMKRIKRDPPRFALCLLQTQDLRLLFTNQNCGIRMTCVRFSCRPEPRIARENGNWLEVGRSTNIL